MEIVRFVDRVDGRVRVGAQRQGSVTPVAVEDLAELWSRPASDLPALLEEPAGPTRTSDQVVLLPPIDGRTEVWAAGVTYERSRSAREEESSVAQVYELVYEADRPELFFKSVAWRVVTDGEPIGIRRDSEINVPEAELALVVNAFGETVGYTVCNDVSSRSIEGENPLYLPQAKMYAGSCALASGIRPAWEVTDPGRLGIQLEVTRDAATAWRASTSTAALYRQPPDLVEWLVAEQVFPAGVVMATGTGLVPEMDFTLQVDDVVRITIDQVGTLTNPVARGREAFSWLTRPIDDLAAGRVDRRHP
jgi:2-dehydro-3-deoxy-D-arabinonate dehydratase